ncbi:MAG: CvpA family protein [Dehalococcoidia bacterium]
MNWLDAVLVAIIAWFTITAFFTGIIREAVTLAALVLGVVLAGVYYQELAEDVRLVVDNGTAARLIAFAAIFGAVALAGQLAAYLLKQAVSIFMLGWADHTMGALFGLAKGALLAELLLILVTTYPFLGLGNTVGDSAIAPLFLKGVPALLRLLPGEFSSAVEAYRA